MLVGREPFRRVLRHKQGREADRIIHNLKQELVSLASRLVFLHGNCLENEAASKGV